MKNRGSFAFAKKLLFGPEPAEVLRTYAQVGCDMVLGCPLQYGRFSVHQIIIPLFWRFQNERCRPIVKTQKRDLHQCPVQMLKRGRSRAKRIKFGMRECR